MEKWNFLWCSPIEYKDNPLRYLVIDLSRVSFFPLVIASVEAFPVEGDDQED